jgi:hypothetical protein
MLWLPYSLKTVSSTALTDAFPLAITRCFMRLVRHRMPVSRTTPRTHAFPIGPQPSGAYMIAGRLTARWTYFLPFTNLASHLSRCSVAWLLGARLLIVELWRQSAMSARLVILAESYLKRGECKRIGLSVVLAESRWWSL